MLGVNHVHPAHQLLAAIVITEMKVAHHDHLNRASEMLVGGELYGMAHLVVIVNVAGNEHKRYDGKQHRGHYAVGIEP